MSDAECDENRIKQGGPTVMDITKLFALGGRVGDKLSRATRRSR
ncbi:hypothetical protein [Piscinibacter sakaiensis]